MDRPMKLAMKVSGVYVLVGAAWILVSGLVVSTMVTDVHLYGRIETYKGWGFVLVTGIALMFAVRRWASMIFHELNERRRMEAQLREKEERYRELYDNSLEGILLTELDGRILAANPAACSMLDRTEEEICSGGRVKIVDTSDPRLKDLLEERRLLGRARGELRFLRRDGTPFPAEVSSMVFRGSDNKERSSMVIHDISARKELERRFRDMLEKINLIAITLDTKGNLTFCNDYLLQLTGWSRHEVSGVDWFATFVPESSGEIRRIFVDSTEAGGIPQHYENPIKTRTGNLRVIRWNNIMMRDERGQISGTASIGEDITERKQAEEEVRRSAAQLRALSNHLQNIREAERTAIAREIHDELGQSLTGIRLDITWIQQKLPQDQKLVLERCAAAEALVDRTIAAVQKISSELRPGMLDELGLAAAMEWEASEFQKRTNVVCDVSQIQEVESRGREATTALFRIFQETLTNVARHAAATKVEVKLSADGADIVMVVRDNGKGISGAKLDSPSSIGLLGMRERANALGGSLIIAGAPGEGATVTVRIPQAGAAT